MKIKNKEGGFTLIEMLVVIAMIGLLSAVVLVALGPSRNKAKDTRVISDVNQARSVAETLYSGVSNTYTGLPASGVVAGGDANFGSLATDVGAQGSALNILVGGSTGVATYAFYAHLITSASTYYCVDSTGYAGNSATVPSGSACPGSGTPAP